jgi:hypothetical protein
MNSHLAKAIGFVCLTILAMAMIFTHQLQYLPALGGAGMALLFFL